MRPRADLRGHFLVKPLLPPRTANCTSINPLVHGIILSY
jgi:hypothetical protein